MLGTIAICAMVVMSVIPSSAGASDRQLLRSLGSCPTPQLEQDFDINRYMGRWYEAARMFNPFQWGDCTTADYSLNDDGTVKVINAQNIFGKLNTIEGTATKLPGTEGSLNVVFEGTPDSGDGSNYDVLDTDYDTYALVYTCSNVQVPLLPIQKKIEYSWILTRDPNPSPQLVAQLKNYANSIGINSKKYKNTKQRNCNYL